MIIIINVIDYFIKLFEYSKICPISKKSMICSMTHGTNHNPSLKLQLNKKLWSNKPNLTSLSPIIKNLTPMAIKISRIINRAGEPKAFNNLIANLCQPNPTIKTSKKRSKKINN